MPPTRSLAGLAVRMTAIALAAATQSAATPATASPADCETLPAPAAIEIIRRDQLGLIDKGWWTALYTASFTPRDAPGYRDLGPMQLFSQDVIQPGGKFAMHPHDNIEVIYLVLAGSFEHADDAGGQGRAMPGDAVLMSAGKGVHHFEKGDDAIATQLVTLWFTPRTRDTDPLHAIAPVWQPGEHDARWRLVAAESHAPLLIDTASRLYIAHVPAGEAIDYTVNPGRTAYLASVEGAAEINGEPLASPDRAIAQPGALSIRAAANATVVLVDLPAD